MKDMDMVKEIEFFSAEITEMKKHKYSDLEMLRAVTELLTTRKGSFTGKQLKWIFELLK